MKKKKLRQAKWKVLKRAGRLISCARERATVYDASFLFCRDERGKTNETESAGC